MFIFLFDIIYITYVESNFSEIYIQIIFVLYITNQFLHIYYDGFYEINTL